MRQKSRAVKKAQPKSQAPAQGKKRSIHDGQHEIERPSDHAEVIEMDRMRKMIAKHMVKSKQTSAHVTTFAEVDVTNLVRWREAHKSEFKERTGIKLTYTPLFIEKMIQAIREFPLINRSLDSEND